MRDCPFCHASVTKLRIISKWAGTGAYRRRVAYVRCLACNARGPTVEYRGDGSDVRFFDVRNDRFTKGDKMELAAGAMAVAAWDGKKSDYSDFKLEG